MVELIEVVFKGERKEIYTNPQQFPFKIGDHVVVEADKGEDLGIVNQLGAILSMKKKNAPLKAIIRKPDPEDVKKVCQNRHKEKAAFGVCKQKIEKFELSMKLVDVEYQFDGNKITFYFTAERRVDFRELVKDLASVYKVRIELRQIGVRDEARRMGGYGICGRRLCCTTFIKEFEPITTQCAKEQNLPLNPQKLSGICGRLMCCLLYEKEYYVKEMQKFPEVESIIKTSKGMGTVEKIDVFKNCLYLKYPNNEWEMLSLEEVTEIIKKHPPIKMGQSDKDDAGKKTRNDKNGKNEKINNDVKKDRPGQKNKFEKKEPRSQDNQQVNKDKKESRSQDNQQTNQEKKDSISKDNQQANQEKKESKPQDKEQGNQDKKDQKGNTQQRKHHKGNRGTKNRRGRSDQKGQKGRKHQQNKQKKRNDQGKKK